MSEEEKEERGSIFPFVLAIGVICVVLFLVISSAYDTGDCQSDNEKFVVSGVIDRVEWYSSTIGIFFEDGRELGISGSPDNIYSLEEMENLLTPGVNYTFYYHKQCVIGEGNEIWYYEGQVVDRIVANRE